MEKTIIVYGSTTGTCESIAETIGSKLGADEVLAAYDLDADKLEDATNILLGTSTWGDGEVQDDWFDALEVIKEADLSGKVVAVFGCGDAESYSDTFCSGMADLYNTAKEQGAEVIGEVSTDGYSFSDSAAVVDGKFVGLALDDMNQGDLTEERIDAWVATLQSSLK